MAASGIKQGWMGPQAHRGHIKLWIGERRWAAGLTGIRFEPGG
jgi:hypothetical protein